MVTAAENLAQLRAALGKHAAFLKHAPLKQVKTQQLDDPDSLSFAILFGYIKDPCSTGEGKSEREVWLHLYPPMSANRWGEVQFHSHAASEVDYVKYDAINIIKGVTRRAAAFVFPGTGQLSKHKVLALTRYYFLEKLVEYNNAGDAEMIANFGVPLSDHVRGALEAVCRELEEAHKADEPTAERSDHESGRTSGVIRTSTTQNISHSSSPLSSPPENPSHLTANGHNDVERETVTTQQGTQGQSIAARFNTSQPTVDALIALKNTEEEVANDVRRIDNEVAALQAKRKAKEVEAEMIRTRQEVLIRGLEPVAAFKLGEELERQKRQKREPTS
ncbi:hypothetical protein NX059_001927 [Plenodomus lindquistii]|nr:hypothetical protein NX059_001927 [Plenodomus lindquistii]